MDPGSELSIKYNIDTKINYVIEYFYASEKRTALTQSKTATASNK